MRGGDDWPEYGPTSRRNEGSGRGATRPGPSSASGLYAAWRDAVAPLEAELPGVKWTVHRPVFNKHVKALREAGFGPERITAMIAAFVADVRRGGVLNMDGKTAWFVFYGRRHHYASAADQPTSPGAQGRQLRRLRRLG